MKKILVIPKYKLSYRNFIEYECGIDFDKSIIIEYQDSFDNEINEIKKYDEAYFVDFCDEYRKILPMIPFKTKCYSILTNEVAEYTDPGVLNIFNSVIEFYDRSIFVKIFPLSFELYTVLKNSGYRVAKLNYNINIIIDRAGRNVNGTVGIICDDFNPNSSFYNILTALCMTNVKRIKLISHMSATKEFINRFNLPVEFCDDINDVICNSTVNIMINFTGNKVNLLNLSLRMNTPVLIGNFDSDYYDNYNSEYIIESDDNVNEIAKKIENLL